MNQEFRVISTTAKAAKSANSLQARSRHVSLACDRFHKRNIAKASNAATPWVCVKNDATPSRAPAATIVHLAAFGLCSILTAHITARMLNQWWVPFKALPYINIKNSNAE